MARRANAIPGGGAMPLDREKDKVSKVKMGTGNEQMLAFARKHGMKDRS